MTLLIALHSSSFNCHHFCCYQQTHRNYFLQTKIGLNSQETGLGISLSDCVSMWLQDLSISGLYVKGEWEVSIIYFHKTWQDKTQRRSLEKELYTFKDVSWANEGFREMHSQKLRTLQWVLCWGWSRDQNSQRNLCQKQQK